MEFIGLDAWARRFLDQRHAGLRVDPKVAAGVWKDVWSRVGAPSRLARLVPDSRYWRNEIDHVIKARGLREFPDYAVLLRRGRGVALRSDDKAAVWDLYVAYQRRLSDLGVMDFNDVLAMAIEEIGREPLEPGYTAVIVDEVSDLNLLGLRLVRQLSGGRPDALLLVGDGRQAIYPGGARLVDAGIDVTGRAVVLRTNYRNTVQVLAAAGLLAPGLTSAEPGEHGDGYANLARPDGRQATWKQTRSLADHDAALIEELRAAASRHGGFAGVAVLCHTVRQVESYLKLLAAEAIPCQPLTEYTGLPTDRVKVGTYKRAKGLDFAAVFLPRLPPPLDPDRSDDPAATERAELRSRELHVAATRARDELWLGRLGW